MCVCEREGEGEWETFIIATSTGHFSRWTSSSSLEGDGIELRGNWSDDIFFVAFFSLSHSFIFHHFRQRRFATGFNIVAGWHLLLICGPFWHHRKFRFMLSTENWIKVFVIRRHCDSIESYSHRRCLYGGVACNNKPQNVIDTWSGLNTDRPWISQYFRSFCLCFTSIDFTQT